MTSQTPEEKEIEEVVEDFVKGMWYGTGESQYPEGAEKKSYHQGFSDAVAMAYIELTGIPKSKGLIDKLLLSQQQKHREELQKAREKTIRDIERRMMGWSGTATAMLKDYRKIIYRDHSELDQDELERGLVDKG